MSNGQRDKPGCGTMFFEPHDQRKSERAPDYRGYILLARDYKAGDKIKLAAWKRDTPSGFELLSLAEDVNYKDWLEQDRKNRNAPREVEPKYEGKKPPRDYDGDIPF